MKKSIGFFLLSIVLVLNTYACPITKEDNEAGGQCINLQNTELYINISGKAKPAVIFISGLGDDTTVWNKVVPAVAQFSQVITYDRVGVGKSQPCVQCKALSAMDNSKMLKAMLQKANIKPPYILVGHSIGGLYAQVFAEMYPRDISGVILIDSVSRNQTLADPVPPKNVSYYKEVIAFSKSQQQARDQGPFPNVPLIVLTATNHPGYEDKELLWQKWQSELATLSSKSFQMIAWGSGHNIQKEQPNLVVDAIATIIKHSASI